MLRHLAVLRHRLPLESASSESRYGRRPIPSWDLREQHTRLYFSRGKLSSHSPGTQACTTKSPDERDDVKAAVPRRLRDRYGSQVYDETSFSSLKM